MCWAIGETEETNSVSPGCPPCQTGSVTGKTVNVSAREHKFHKGELTPTSKIQLIDMSSIWIGHTKTKSETKNG